MNRGRFSIGGAAGALAGAALLVVGATTALAWSTTTTTALHASSISAGSSDYDTATVDTYTTSATGTVTFTIYTNSTCSAQATVGTSNEISGQPASAALVSNSTTKVATATSPSVTFYKVGTYYWGAVYSGDARNETSSSLCSSEPLTVTKATPGISTTLTSTSIPAGSTDSDKANLSGGDSPTGSVTFTIYTNSSCSTQATVGTGNDISAQGGSASVSGDGSYNSATVTFYQATPTYYWLASYSGDTHNISVTSACTSEITTVTKDGPSITTQLTSTAILVGQSDLDHATLTGATANATGTVTFTIYTDGSCSVQATTGTGKDISAQAGSASVSGNGTYASATVWFYKSGNYYLQAVYSGDANNVSAKSGCGSEIVDVGNVPTPTPTATPTSGVLGITIPDTGTGPGPTSGLSWLGLVLLLGGSLVVATQFAVRRRVRKGKIDIQNV